MTALAYSTQAPWWHLAVQLSPLALATLAVLAALVEGLRRLYTWARRRKQP